MDDSTFYFWLSFLLLLISFFALSWSFFAALFLPTQWLTPVDKVILITGCDSGIGLEIAKYLHSKGSIIIATVLSRSSPGALELKTLKLNEDRIFLIELNLIDSKNLHESIEKIRKILDERKCELHALINNAGICVFGEFDFQTFKQIESQINVNFLGTIHLTKLLLPMIIKSKSRIINLSSVNALVPFPGLSVYSATKKAIETFSESLSIEMKKFNVKTVCIRLGDYAKLTNIMVNHRKIMKDQLEQFDESKRRLYGDYFEKYHENVMKNYGMFSPKSYASSTLFDDFEKAVYAVNPPAHLISSTFSYKLLILFLYYLPFNMRCYLLNKFVSETIK
uniref:D-beta-hydroxybutyrate dehydrogenase, mitochondrial-like n=1 Tax=Dermatophagoides pteronyssinus TaxID=6956 RepID=A0A6P6Y568_DERPT|nr:D-beta-hydroxybutyrate dehydrogenase, mitochondrial-like [Dermatophagoides pteronyssinus]